MRKLASIQKVLNVRPIEGADLIEVVDVLGWSVVVKKEDNLKKDDLIVYYEVDSFLSENDPRYNTPVFQERFITWEGKRGMRLKTIKLRKQISQGLVLPLSMFPEIKKPQEGDDVTELLKIEKWEPASESSGNSGGAGVNTSGSKPFPDFIRKTDQERVQNYMNILHNHCGVDETFEQSIKLDGSSMTVFYLSKDSPYFKAEIEEMERRLLRNKNLVQKLVYRIKKRFGFFKNPEFLTGVCSRNIHLNPDNENHFTNFAAREVESDRNMLDQLAWYGRNLAIQGELIGPTIQQNYEKTDDFEFYVFDVLDIDKQEYLLPEDRRMVVSDLGLKHVPILDKAVHLMNLAKPGDGTARGLVDGILEAADGPGKNLGVKREGVVYKSNKMDFSFKAISNSYLLKKKD